MNPRLRQTLAALLAIPLLSLHLVACAGPEDRSEIAPSPPAAVRAALPPAVENQSLPSLAPMLERVLPAVVNIATESRVLTRPNPLLDDPFFRRFFDLPERPRERHAQSLGSGVIVDAERGYIVTNHHVVDRADAIQITLSDGRTFDAEVIGSDPETDVAVIRIPAQNLVGIPMADSDRLRVGDFVVAIGNPFGLNQTVTSGIVSALGRTGLGIVEGGYEDFIQTDASINPGNSGGALVDLRGELVGINTAIFSRTGGNIGIGFAIPANMVARLMDQLVRHGEVRRGQLGVLAQDLTPDLAQAFSIERSGGAVVTQIVPRSAAERAGVRIGDVIVAVNGRPIRSAFTLRNAIGLLQVGEQVTLDILRDGEPMTLNVRIGEAAVSQTEGAAGNPRLAGAVFEDIAPGSPLHGRIEGVLVKEAEPGSPAALAGLRRNDVIVSVNREPTDSVQKLQRVAARSESLLLNVRRGRAALFILIR